MLEMTATALANSAARRSGAEAVIASDSSGRLHAFRDAVASSSFGTNASAHKVAVYDTAGELLDTRTFYVLRAGGDAARGLADFRAAQGSWLVRRETFEDLWEHGRALLYGVVNAGGMGAEHYGFICLVIADPGTPAPAALAVFPSDSASRYVSAMGDLDRQRCVEEATSWEDRSDLAVIEYGADAVACPASEWPHLVCARDRYLEVARAGDLPLARLTEVRLRAAQRRYLDELQARALVGDALSPVQAQELNAYHVVQHWRRTLGIPVSEVP